MLQWLAANAATIIISLLLVAVVAAIVVHMIKTRKTGCCGGCSGCSGCSSCASKSQNKFSDTSFATSSQNNDIEGKTSLTRSHGHNNIKTE